MIDLPILEIAKKVNIPEEYIIPFGKDKAKIDLRINDLLKEKKDGKLVLVTAITPSKAGEGKTTSSIALHDGLNLIGVKSLLCLREPSLGPVFGIKGGATGGGKSSVIPSEDINLHFTGDMHALTSSINLISAIIDNHIYQGNELRIDPNRILWKRALDMNDRALRKVTVMKSEKNCSSRDDEFVITVASEMMAILCLAKDIDDFLTRINKIIVAFDMDGNPIALEKLSISHAVGKLMKQAFNPNLVQTLEKNPVIIHGGPFANIAHGCNSLIATKMALKLADVVVTEAGFGSDLGAEKFFDIKCRVGDLKPDCVVMVATIRALKLHGGVSFENIEKENIDALKVGVSNLKQHLENMEKFGVKCVVCINHFESDTEAETLWLSKWCKENDVPFAFCDAFLTGGKGAISLATLVKKTLDNNKNNFCYLYDEKDSICNKINKICREIYRADGVIYSEKAMEDIKKYTLLGFDKIPVCIAKTPLSFSDNPKLIGTPRGFNITIKEVRLSLGAGFIVALAGNIMTMPGLSKIPSAVRMEEEKI